MTAFSTATASNLTTENPLAGFAGLTAPSVTALAGKFHIALPGNVKVEVFGTFTYAAGVPTAGIISDQVEIDVHSRPPKIGGMKE